jgi:hypothetical protein
MGGLEPQNNSGGVSEAIRRGGRRRAGARALDGDIVPLIVNLRSANRQMARELEIEAAAHRPEERGVTRSLSIYRRLTHSLRHTPEQSVRESARALPSKGVNRPELVGIAMRRLKVPLLRLQSRRYRSCRSIAPTIPATHERTR